MRKKEGQGFAARVMAISDEPGIRSLIETMKTELIHWCMENGDYAMLENGALKKKECSPAKDWP
ncbi:hypothetical protein D3C75_602750 [compost metagenome]